MIHRNFLMKHKTFLMNRKTFQDFIHPNHPQKKSMNHSTFLMKKKTLTIGSFMIHSIPNISNKFISTCEKFPKFAYLMDWHNGLQKFLFSIIFFNYILIGS